MKTPKDNIFRLIMAMSAAEKRYFKRHYASEKNLLTDLFDYINGMDKYQEENIRSFFADSKLSKNLKVYKVQLSDLLLKSLSSYHSKKQLRSKIRMGLEEYDILLQKELFDLAESKLSRLKDTCIKAEEQNMLHLIYQLEHEYQQLSNPFSLELGFVENTELAITESARVVLIKKHLQRLNQFKNFSSPLSINAKQHEAYIQLLENMPQRDQIDQFGFNYLANWYRLKGNIHFLLQQQIQGELYFDQVIQICENKLTNKATAGRNTQLIYFNILSDYLFFLIENKYFEKAMLVCEKLNVFFKNFPHLEKHRLSLYLLECQFYLKQQNFVAITDDFIQKIAIHIQHYKLEKHPNTTSIYFRLALASMIQNDPQQAHFFFRRLQRSEHRVSKTIATASDLLEMISHYETNDQFIIQNWVSSLKRKEKTNENKLSSFMNAIIVLLNALSTQPKTEHAEHVHIFQNSMDQFPNDPCYQLLDSFYFDEWLQAILNGRSFSEQTRLFRKNTNKTGIQTSC